MILAWPPRSPDAIPCEFFLWGYVKDQVYVPLLPASVPELKVVTCYKQFGTLDYRVDVCRITKAAHIEHL